MSAPMLKGLRALLITADSGNTLGGRVFGLELPVSEAASMPRKAVVLRLSGGPGSNDYARIGRVRVDVWCYGQNFSQALEVQQLVQDALKHVKHDEQIVSTVGVLIHNCIEAGGPHNFRDPETDWPVIIQSWLVTASETVTT